MLSLQQEIRNITTRGSNITTTIATTLYVQVYAMPQKPYEAPMGVGMALNEIQSTAARFRGKNATATRMAVNKMMLGIC
jgi:hypothetical protein